MNQKANCELSDAPLECSSSCLCVVKALRNVTLVAPCIIDLNSCFVSILLD